MMGPNTNRGRLGTCGTAVIAVLLLVSVILPGCGTATGEGTRVVVTIPPLRLVAEQLLDPGTPVATLLPGGVSRHAYDPLPSAVRTAATARVLLAAHPDVDGWVTSLQAGEVWWLTAEDEDPHSWLDPLHVRDALPGLADALCEAYEEQCPAIRQRAVTLARELEDVTAEGIAVLSGIRLVPSGVFLSTFGARFGLQAEAVIAPVEGVEPSPADVARSIDEASTVGLVVGQAGFPELAAAEVARASGARFVRIDPLGSRPPATSYSGLIADIIRALTE